MKDCIEVICSRCTYRWECGPFKDCVPKKILLNEMSYREAIPCSVKTFVEKDGTVAKDYICSRCRWHFSSLDVLNRANYCPNCGQKQDWSGLCDK